MSKASQLCKLLNKPLPDAQKFCSRIGRHYAKLSKTKTQPKYSAVIAVLKEYPNLKDPLEIAKKIRETETANRRQANPSNLTKTPKNSKIIYMEQSDCRRCGEPVWKVWKRGGGSDKWYNDKELTERHVCEDLIFHKFRG